MIKLLRTKKKQIYHQIVKIIVQIFVLSNIHQICIAIATPAILNLVLVSFFNIQDEFFNCFPFSFYDKREEKRIKDLWKQQKENWKEKYDKIIISVLKL